MTRETDKFPGDVNKRAKMMIAADVDYALSIHFNGFSNPNANGCEVFVPYGESVAEIECGFYKELTKYFAPRIPFARSNDYYDRNKTFDKKMNIQTETFDKVKSGMDYFGFIRNCWKEGISADLLEICFLTNKKDFDNFINNKESIANGLAKSIVEAYNEKYITSKKIIKKPKAKFVIN